MISPEVDYGLILVQALLGLANKYIYLTNYPFPLLITNCLKVFDIEINVGCKLRCSM